MAFLSTTDGHQLYYERHGNLSGPTILFLHGGPGLGTSQNDLGYFDLTVVNVILLDQRGAGKSRPAGSLENNTSQNLVADIQVLLEELDLAKVILFGGSWGSTLALLFAITHPNRVSGLVLRGLFTASKNERQFFEEGEVALFYPKAVSRYLRQVPASHSGSIGSYYFKQILEGLPALQDKLAYELMHYGISVSRKIPYTQAEIESRLAGANQRQYARILAHFSINDFFLPDEYIINHLHTISHIPIHLVHGRYDMITTPKLAIQLAEKHKHFELRLVDGGHSPHESTVKTALQEEMVNLLTQLS
ncbi:MAG: alpha/beta fold hydrolase [Saprospiraceae bacterium]|nr:alpha/beta fold hydrolase [Saprospiraceae bacterium]